MIRSRRVADRPATDAVSSSSLAGMQPTFKQVPPILPFSMRAIESPADAP